MFLLFCFFLPKMWQKWFSGSATCGAIWGGSMPKFVVVTCANTSQLQEIWKTTIKMSTGPAQFIMCP